jgi:ABC-2 type transport system permease protein
MIARAAQRPEIWPHLLAIAWQAVTVAMIVRVGANLFRRSVLKSGGAGIWRKLIERSSWVA